MLELQHQKQDTEADLTNNWLNMYTMDLKAMDP